MRNAGSAERSGGHRANGDESGRSGEVAKIVESEEFLEIMDRGRAEEKNGVEVAAKDAARFFPLWVRGEDGAIGDDFRDARAEFLQSCNEIRIAAVAAREKHVTPLDFGGQLLGEGEAIVFGSDVGHAQAGFCRGFGRGGAYHCEEQLLRGFGERDIERAAAVNQCAKGILAGEEEPIKLRQLVQRRVKRRKIFGCGELDEWKKRRLGTGLL